MESIKQNARFTGHQFMGSLGAVHIAEKTATFACEENCSIT